MIVRPFRLFLFVLFVSCFCLEIEGANESSPWFTILHVTDVHGWVFGHPHNSTLNTDFGDWTSFLLHMKNYTEANKEELMVFDTGDLVEGTGLSDATPVHGQYILDIMQRVHDYVNYQGLTMGNHDQEYVNEVELFANDFIPSWNGVYVTSNTIYNVTNATIGVPYFVMTTPLTGYRFLVLGYIYNFDQHAPDVDVIFMNESMREKYLSQAMAEPDIDAVITLNHINPPDQPEFYVLYKTLRRLKPTTPLIMLCGHGHIKYYEDLDLNAFAIESGRYFETFGYIRFQLSAPPLSSQVVEEEDEKTPPVIESLSHTWPATSKENLMVLSHTTSETFDTNQGGSVKDLIHYYYNHLDLNKTLGCSPMYFSPYDPLNSTSSLYNLYLTHVVPDLLVNPAVSGSPVFITNTATLRSPLYEGVITKNDIFALDPFNDTYVYNNSITGQQLEQILAELEPSRPGLFEELSMPAHIKAGIRSRTTSCLNRAPLQYTKLPSFIWTDPNPIDPNATYSVIAATYDFFTLAGIYSKLFGQELGGSSYPTAYQSFTIWSNFVEEYFKC